MRIGFIGAGRVGYTLGKYLKTTGKKVSGYYSRNPEHAMEAAKFTDTMYFSNVSDLIKESDAVFLTVSDNAIKTVFDEIKALPCTDGKIFCHTSGATSSRVFDDTPFQVYGYSVHPIYAVSDKYTAYKSFSNAFITIEGNEKYLNELVSYFRSVCLETGTISTDSKVKYHASAVFASNLVCGIYGTAVRLMTECGFDEETAARSLKGLFLDNATGLTEKGPVKQLTGPIDRNDTQTVSNHISALSKEDADIYKLLSLETLKIAKIKNIDTDYSEMEKILRNGG